jgi:hypothetical protein
VSLASAAANIGTQQYVPKSATPVVNSDQTKPLIVENKSKFGEVKISSSKHFVGEQKEEFLEFNENEEEDDFDFDVHE